MFVSKRHQEITESTESKLARMFAEMNGEKNAGEPEKLICETECTMGRIRVYSDFLYLMRVRPLQTMCYYGAGVMLLLALAALWCAEWVLLGIFGVLFIILATLPHNMRIQYFNRQADLMESSYGRVINADFGDKDITLTMTASPLEESETPEEAKAASPKNVSLDKAEDGEEQSDSPKARTTAVAEGAQTVKIPYERIALAYECSHSFYLFPVDENRRRGDTIICDKTQFLRGTPMQLRDTLARKCGKSFKIKVKKA